MAKDDNLPYVPDDDFIDTLSMGNALKERQKQSRELRQQLELYAENPPDDVLELEIINNLKKLISQNDAMLEDLILKIESGADVFYSDAYSKVSKAQADAHKMFIDLYNSKQRNKTTIEVTKLNTTNRTELAQLKASSDNSVAQLVQDGAIMAREAMRALLRKEQDAMTINVTPLKSDE
jgi:hypothetical protein